MRLIAALCASGALAVLNFVQLAGAGYAGFANRHLDRPLSPAVQQSAQLAARWQPWSSSSAALEGWLHAENGQRDAARAAYGRALRLAPADALLSTEYALALGRIGQFDATMAEAIRHAAQRAPTSGVIRAAIADLGLSYWARGTAELQMLWLAGMRDELARNRAALLDRVLRRGQGLTFCRGPATGLGEGKWCTDHGALLLQNCIRLTGLEPLSCAPAR